jgi:phosphoribosylformimino-5-aminoimidazole carboxamide ribotide isomerase
MTIIPAIDIIEGKCVRLTEGDYSTKKIYNHHPLEVARQFEDAGIQRLHLVDLDGAKAGAVKNWKVLELLASKTNLQIDFGGGIKTNADVDTTFNAGASWVTVGSIAVKNADLFTQWLMFYGANKFLVGADVKDECITIDAWMHNTETSVYQFIQQYQRLGVNTFFCTDVSKDGKLAGPSTDLYKKILEQYNDVQLIASGGIASMHDIQILEQIGCNAVIIGKAIYEGHLTLQQLTQWILKP